MNIINKNEKLNVCIIGAGLTGLVTAKICCEHHLQPIVYERTNFIGGLWRYRDQVEIGQASVMKSTVVNSSKVMTAFSDYPFPDNYPNFMPNELMYEYLKNYTKDFNLYSYIKFQHDVINIEHDQDGDGMGYLVTIKNLENNFINTIHYDAIAICTGHHHTPKYPPTFTDQELFQGKIVHSHDVRSIVDNENFIGKRVVVLGIGNSGGDVAAEAAPVAKQVYLSSRNGGTWLLRRTGLNGQPIDTVGLRRASLFALHLLPYSLRCSVIEFIISKMVGHDLLGIRPEKTRFFGQHSMVNDHIPTYIHLGWIKMKFGIERFTTNGVVFKRDNGRITECDIVVMATGYKNSFPFIHHKVFGNLSKKFDLYKHVFDPYQPKPERLAFIGLPAANGSLPPISEIQARWFCMLLKGQCKSLPNQKKMFEKIEKNRKWIANRFGKENIERFRFEVEMTQYMDDVARLSGLMPNIYLYMIKDPKLYWSLIFKPCIAAQYRLQGPNSKPKQARHLILTIDNRIKYPYRKNGKNSDNNDDDLNENFNEKSSLNPNKNKIF